MPDDPIEVAGNVHRLAFENDRVRVMEVVFKPGDKAAMHRHPENMLYIKEPGTIRFSLPSGGSNEAVLHKGQIIYNAREVIHAAENVGNTTVEILAIEFKE